MPLGCVLALSRCGEVPLRGVLNILLNKNTEFIDRYIYTVTHAYTHNHNHSPLISEEHTSTHAQGTDPRVTLGA